jgi:predicted dehydrogenase/threonine dehydrogenase-like Zn-dependent dehydrogenase
MRQLTQRLKDGKMEILEVPLPVLGSGTVLVKNHYSLISTGTEGSTVSAARKSLIGKAKDRPQQVKQVIDLLKQQGPVQTYHTVMKKLDAYSPLGYSSAGEVIEVAPDVKGFSVGDIVACGGGGYASHAEVVAVPQNLCVKIPIDKNFEFRISNFEFIQGSMKRSAYNTLGAIALQGVRQADLKIGETCAVIGLGLIGQLTSLILRAGGIKVVGIDIDSRMVDIAREHCADLAFNREEPGLAEKIDEFTDGIGVDAVVIAAATSSLDPVNFAGRIARKKGRVVIVGDVPTGFDREHYYRKELELRMSCSYGPGRYDINYEEKGIDYPAGYVRWTENRNMQAFQELVHSGKIDIDYLTTHVFKLDNAPSAYDMIMERKELFIGILIEYDIDKKIESKKVFISQKSEVKMQKLDKVGIAFIGAGSYAMGHLLPNIPKDKDVILKGVMTSSGTSSRTVAEKYGFEFCTSDENDIFNNSDINTIFIATRHNTHAEYVMKALKAGKNVYVEKPLCLSETELNAIVETYNAKVRRQNEELQRNNAEVRSKNEEVRKDREELISKKEEGRVKNEEGVNKVEGRIQNDKVKIQETKNSSFYIRTSDLPLLMLGFNRRFSLLTEILKEKIGEGPMSMIYRINAGHIPAGLWVQDQEIGGGRIIGEVCHFVDYLTYMNGSLPESVYATVLPDPEGKEDTVNVSLSFENGSIGTISYFSTGSKSLSKEYIEIYRAGLIGVLKDFKELEIYGSGKTFTKKLISQDKGQKTMIKTFLDAIKQGKPSPISFEEIYTVTLTTFKVIESIRIKQKVTIK